MARINLDEPSMDNVGLDEAFQNWLSTTVDTINSNCEVLEAEFAAHGTTVQLTRCDTSASSNITLSEDFKNFMEKLIERIDKLESQHK